MKKRIFSSLLMATFFFAAIGSFTSCKDYDDDINANTSSIQTLQSQLSTLQSELASVKTAAQTAQANYDELKSSLSNYATESELQEVKDALATVEANYVKAAYLEGVIADLKTLISSKVDQEEYDAKVKEIEEAIDAYDARLNTLGTSLNDIETAYKAADINLQNQIDALNAYKEACEKAGLPDAVDSLNNRIDQLNSAIGLTKEQLSNIESLSSLSTQMQELSDKVDALSTNINLLTVLVTRQLSSLVAIPDVYLDGIEAIDFKSIRTATYHYNVGTTEKPKAGKDNGDENQGMTGYVITDTINMSGVGVAHYHVNPANADLTDYKVNFFCNSAQVVNTRKPAAINSFAQPIKSDVDATWYEKKTGFLGIPFTVGKETIEDTINAHNAEVNETKGITSFTGRFIAASLNRGDTTVVTSDYMLLNNRRVYNLFVGDLTWDESDDNRFKDAIGSTLDVSGAAINGNLHKKFSDLAKENVPATHTVRWDSCINVTALLVTHYTTDSIRKDSANATTPSNLSGSLSASEFNAMGLHYSIANISYTLGTNETDESLFISLSTDNDGNVWATPQTVGEDGKPAGQSIASVGRTPILSIEIRNEQDSILGYAFMKLQIVASAADAKVIDLTYSGDALTYACTGDSIEFAWTTIQDKFLNELNVSKADFDKVWYIIQYNKKSTTKEEDGSTTTVILAKQYYASSADSACKKGDAAKDSIGAIYEISNTGNSDATTHTLKWVIDCKSYASYDSLKAALGIKNGTNATDLVRYVRYKSRNTATHQDFYVKLTIPAGTIKFNSYENSNKALSFWYQLESATPASSAEDAKEVRVNVPTPEAVIADGDTTYSTFDGTVFKKSLNGFFEGTAAATSTLNSQKVAMNFGFVLPNEDNTSAAVLKKLNVNEKKMTWIVQGYSGLYYLLTLKDSDEDGIYDQIVATQSGKTTKASDKKNLNALVVSLEKNTETKLNDTIIYSDTEIACDILNKNKHTELAGGETFTAYLEMYPVTDGTCCYTPEVENGLFNVRFQRPVDFYGVNGYVVPDATNGYEIIDFSNLVKAVDWRDYDILMTEDSILKKIAVGNNRDEAVDSAYYHLNLIADTANILTDLGKGTDIRDTYPESGDESAVEAYVEKYGTNLKLYSDIQLTLVGLDENGNETTEEDNIVKRVLKYKNTRANTAGCHLFVPIRMTYPFSWYDAKTNELFKTYSPLQTVYAVITVKKTEGNAQRAK